MATTGVVGQHWRAGVTSAGFVEPHDGTAPLGWYVAAADRWHDPRNDTGVRHQRIAGTAVFETRMRIPGGDAVQRVWSVADAGGYTLLSIDNDSPSPIAVAFTRPDLATDRPVADIPIDGISLPNDAVALPVGHRATVTVAIAHRGSGPTSLPPGLPGAAAVTRGWQTRIDSASRLDLPEAALVEAVRAARCEVLLVGPADSAAEPERHLLGIGELVRLGDLDDRQVIEIAPSIAAAVAVTARRGHQLAPAALDAAAVALAVAGERRALSDLARVRDSVGLDDRPNAIVEMAEATGDIAIVPTVERRLLAGSTLFPTGIPDRWRGVDFEAHRLVAGPASTLSLAVRWHGNNAAVLWEVAGEPITLSASVGGSRWSSAAPRGEALWRLGEPSTL